MAPVLKISFRSYSGMLSNGTQCLPSKHKYQKEIDKYFVFFFSTSRYIGKT